MAAVASAISSSVYDAKFFRRSASRALQVGRNMGNSLSRAGAAPWLSSPNPGIVNCSLIPERPSPSARRSLRPHPAPRVRQNASNARANTPKSSCRCTSSTASA